MIKLIKLELKRNKINTYVTASIIACIIMIAFIYFVAYVAQVENEKDFQNYTNIFCFTEIIGLFIFSILSSVMYVRLIINEYSANRIALLFSYPVSRKKILLAKLLVVFLFTAIAMFICTLIPLSIFCVSEYVSPIVADTFSARLLVSTFQTVIISVLAADCIGLISMRIGFIKKSVPITLITSFILTGIIGNVTIAVAENVILSFITCGVLIIALITIVIELMHKINHIEAE